MQSPSGPKVYPKSPDDCEGMDLDSVPDMAGAGDGARSDVGRLGLGQVRLGEGVDRGVLLQGVGDNIMGLDDTIVALAGSLPDDGSGPADRPAGFSSSKQRRAWLYKQKRKQLARAGSGPPD